MDEVGWLIVAVCTLTGVSLFFTLNSLALRTLSRIKLQEAFKNVNKEEMLDVFLANSEKLIFTCSLFRIVANITVLLILTELLLTRGYILIFLVAVVLLATFSLTIPYSWAKYTGEKVLVRTHRLLTAFVILASPFLYILKFHDTLVRRLAGVSETGDLDQEERQEELLSVVKQGRAEGVVDEEEMEMIGKVLELSDSTADEIMTPRTDVVAIMADANLKTVLDTVSKAGHSRIPVCEKNIDNIIGLIYAKDLLSEIGKSPENFRLRDKMRKAYFVPETKPLRDLLHEFQNQKLHIAVVLDEYGGTAGIVTIEDILEELVGEIVDEYEKTPPETVKRINETTIEIDARMYIDDLNNEFELDLPEDEDYDTVGGFVFSHLGYIPKSGETFEHDNVKFTIAAAETRRIKRIRIQLLSDEKANQ